MCACVLRAVASEVAALIHDRDYVPCRGLLEASANVTLKRLVLRKRRRLLFSRYLKGPYSYKVLDMSLGDDGVLVAPDEGSTDVATSLLNDQALVSEKFLAEYRLSSVTAVVASAQVDTLDGIVDAKVGVDIGKTASTGRSFLKVSRIEGANLERLILELKKNWRLNKQHRLWKHVTGGGNTPQLCFVSNVVSTEKKLSLSCKHNTSGEVRTVLGKLLALSVKASEGSNHFLVMPAGAALAYKVQQLEVNSKDGSIDVPLGKMAVPEMIDVDPDKEIEDCRLFYSEFFGQLPKEHQVRLRQALKNYLSGSGDYCNSRQNLSRLKKLSKLALPTDADPKVEEIVSLLKELAVPGLLDLPKEGVGIYGIRYFVTALLQLSSETLPWLFDYTSDRPDEDEECTGHHIVKELENLIECKAEGAECDAAADDVCVLDFLSLATADKKDLFLCAWRAAYVAAIHMYGLPEA